MINCYSRLGGSYTNHKFLNSQQGNVVVFPLYSTLYKEDKTVRNLIGILIRATPYRASQSSDKILFITIERINASEENNYFWNINHRLGDTVERNNEYYLIRQNSINRVDAVYLTFINNVLFNVSNKIEEICLNERARKPHLNLNEIISNFISNYPMWISSRITERVIMATCGTNQEEGLMSQ